jgi:hypothetical protein
VNETPTLNFRVPGGLYFEVPPTAIPCQCSGCHARIYWIKTPKGATCPVDPDGRSHFQTCPNASDFHKRRPK